jgi:hypothetical protein
VAEKKKRQDKKKAEHPGKTTTKQKRKIEK